MERNITTPNTITKAAHMSHRDDERSYMPKRMTEGRLFEMWGVGHAV